jgi:type II secretory pathway component PulM
MNLNHQYDLWLLRNGWRREWEDRQRFRKAKIRERQITIWSAVAFVLVDIMLIWQPWR